jgi:hypothetical protein
MVCEDIALFQEIWEQTCEEQGEDSFMDIRRHLQCCEDIDMAWINMHWGVFQVPDASTSLAHEAALAFDKVVEQKHVSLFLTQFTNEGTLTMLSLEASFDLMTTSWGIKVREKNESQSSDKEHVKN